MAHDEPEDCNSPEPEEEVEILDKGYEKQLAVERLMAKMKHESLVNPQGYVKYTACETEPADEEEDLRMFNRNRPWG